MAWSSAYEMDKDVIDDKVTKVSPGNYKLGYVRDDRFYVHYVGRADTDLNRRLKEHIDAAAAGKEKAYTHFKYQYAPSIKAAYDQECQDWHNFKNLDNENHPDRPDGKDYECPVCGA